MSKNVLIIITLIIVYNFSSAGIRAQTEELPVRQPMKPAIENSLRHKALSKKVYGKKIIADMENRVGWSVEGIAKIDFTSDRSIDGEWSLRFRTKKVDRELVEKNVAENGSYSGNTGGSTRAILAFDEPQDWSEYNRIAVWVFVHPAEQGYHTFYIGFDTKKERTGPLDPHYITAIHTMKPNQWNYVLWEIENLERYDVTGFYVYQRLRGNDPEVEDEIVYDVDHVELQKVDAEKYEGWEVVPGGISFSHIGYRPEQPKKAFASDLPSGDFQIVDVSSEKVLISKTISEETTRRGSFQVMDFSELHKPGRYYIRAGERESRPFNIAGNVWRSAVKKVLNFYYCERCGHHVPGIHRVCHRDWQGIHNGKKKIINGGWHDAGDLSQGSFRTGMSVYAMLDIYRQLKLRNTDSELQERLLEEALWGLKWLLKTRFSDGYRITWSTMRIYTDCVTGTLDDVITKAQNDPFENFLASAIEAFAYETLKDTGKNIAEEALTAAVEDWKAAAARQSEWLQSGNSGRAFTPLMSGVYLTSSWGIVSSLKLYRITGERKYMDKAVEYGKILLSCQERTFVEDIPITGYFYNGPEKNSILHHQHAAFEESPLLALAELCETLPDHPEWMEWYAALTIHAEYFMKRGAEYSAPYKMLSNSVYRKSEVMRVEDTDIRKAVYRQFNDGVMFSDNYSLRMFPIWDRKGFHGNTAAQLSEALALQAAVLVRNDLSGETLVERQMHWVAGLNPFSQSLIYGEGYDFNSQYAPSDGDMVGALPVGVDCLRDDEPLWYDSNYPTYKEVWVVPASRFLWNAAYIGIPAYIKGTAAGGNKVVVFVNKISGSKFNVEVKDNNTFEINLPSGSYAIEFDGPRINRYFVSGGIYSLNLSPSRSISLLVSSSKSGSRITAALEGTGTHELEIRTFNCSVDETTKQVNLTGIGKAEVVWNLRTLDRTKPWVAVVIPDSDMSQKQDVTGTYND